MVREHVRDGPPDAATLHRGAREERELRRVVTGQSNVLARRAAQRMEHARIANGRRVPPASEIRAITERADFRRQREKWRELSNVGQTTG